MGGQWQAMSKSLILLLCGVVTDALPACARTERTRAQRDRQPFLHRPRRRCDRRGADLPGADDGPAALSALCRATAGARALRSAPRPTGQRAQAPRGRRRRSAYAGMDLYVRGQARRTSARSAASAATDLPRERGRPCPPSRSTARAPHRRRARHARRTRCSAPPCARYGRVAFAGSATRSDRSFAAALASEPRARAAARARSCA